MAQFHHVNNFAELIKIVSEVGSSNPIIVFVSGAKDADGKSWCPDCVKVEPIVEEAMRKDAPVNSHFISVAVERAFWKDSQCVFRTDNRLKLSYIPALVRWPNAHQKLEMEQCGNPEMIKMLFEDE